MRILAVENFVGTPLGLVGNALAEAGAAVGLCRPYLGQPLPGTPAGYDGIVVLGGEQSALDDADHPYLPRLAALTRAFTEADVPVLGICLGSQLVARGAGAQNILGRPVEFGWHEVTPTAAGRADPLMAPLGQSAPLFHWHLDTFTLPPGAVHLAASAQTAIQAFRIGRATYGVQFHFEADRKLVEQWSADFAPEIAAYAPAWQSERPALAARYGPRADAAGAAIARAWVGLAR